MTTLLEDQTLLSNTQESESRQTLRVLELILVLAVAFGSSLLNSTFVFLGYPPAANYSSVPRLSSAICTELAALGVLAYVWFRQGKHWKILLGQWQLRDIGVALGLLLYYTFAVVLLNLIIQKIAYSLTGHWIQPVDVKKMLGMTLSPLSAVFVLINPFFEELIVRAYLMSEVIDITKNKTLAAILSTALQASYHLYQGGLNATLLGICFLIMSVYYAKTRRIAPIILAHFILDTLALLSTR